MTDDKIINLHTTRKAGHVREVPSENPDAPHIGKRRGGLRNVRPCRIGFKPSETQRTLREVLARLDLLDAENKSIRHLLLSLLDDDDFDPDGRIA